MKCSQPGVFDPLFAMGLWGILTQQLHVIICKELTKGNLVVKPKKFPIPFFTGVRPTLKNVGLPWPRVSTVREKVREKHIFTVTLLLPTHAKQALPPKKIIASLRIFFFFYKFFSNSVNKSK